MTISNDQYQWEDDLKRDIRYGIVTHRAKSDGISGLVEPEIPVQQILLEAEIRGYSTDRIYNIITAAKLGIDWHSLERILGGWIEDDHLDEVARNVITQTSILQQVEHYVFNKVRDRSEFRRFLCAGFLFIFGGFLGFCAAWATFW